MNHGSQRADPDFDSLPSNVDIIFFHLLIYSTLQCIVITHNVVVTSLRLKTDPVGYRAQVLAPIAAVVVKFLSNV